MELQAAKTACESIIETDFGLKITVGILPAADLIEALEYAPNWWNNGADSKHNAIFVIPLATAAEVCASVGKAKPEYERVAYYDCFYAQQHEVWNDQWRVGDGQGQIFSIDYLIGEPSSLRRGFGKEMIAQMLDMLRKAGARTVIVEPESDNIASNRALEANGFLWNGTDYHLNLG